MEASHKRLKVSNSKTFEYPSAKVCLQDLPFEVTMEIFRYLPLSKAVQIRHQCRAFRLGLPLALEETLKKMWNDVRLKANSLKSETLSLVIDRRPPNCLQMMSLEYWWELHNDLMMLKTMIRRYRRDLMICSFLACQLAPVFEEIEMSLTKYCSSKPRPFLLNKFLRRFTQEIEIHFYDSQTYVPFELRLTELLFCCPFGNLKVEISRIDESTNVSFNAAALDFFSKFPRVKLDLVSSKFHNDNTILQFMREYIRNINRVHLRTVLMKLRDYSWLPDGQASENELDLLLHILTFPEEQSVEYYQKNTDKKEEVYEVQSPLNLGITICFLEMSYKPAKKPSNLDGKFESTPVPCSACSIPEFDNFFHLMLTNESGGLFENRIIFYSQDRGNYLARKCFTTM